MTGLTRDKQLLERARDRFWYHTLELPGYVTNGWFDLRPYVNRYRLPEHMGGMRVLDVGTWDGFWAFEMERRGAEVVAIDLDREEDLDWPPRRRPARYPDSRRGDGFRIAHELLGSRVERIELSVYDARPERLGTFDLVFCGSVLIHLRDQLLALERIASVCDGTLISAEEYEGFLGLLPFPVSRYRADREASVVFWQPSLRTWKQMMRTAGFDRIEERDRFKLRSTEGFSVPHAVLHASKGPA